MPDDLRRTRGGTAVAEEPDTIALVSSARLLPAATQATRKAAEDALGKAEKWQAEAWVYYDTRGELRNACAWYANALSRIRLTLARRGKAGDDPTPLDPNDPADARQLAMLEDLGSQEGQSALLSAFAPHLVVPGVCYLVGIDPKGDTTKRRWLVLSQDEIRTAKTGDGYEVRDPSEAGKWVNAGPDVLPVKVWRQHARYHWVPDSPTRPLLQNLRELSLLTAHVEASATSRLAGAGILLVKKGTTFQSAQADKPPAEGAGSDQAFSLVDILGQAMVTAIGDRDAADAVVPILAEVPVGPGERVADMIDHKSFSTPFDQATIDLRAENRSAFAVGMDMPPEVLLGTAGINHWGQWKLEDTAIKFHITPMCEGIVDGLTVGWFRPLQEAHALLPGGVPVDEDVVVWFDTSNLTQDPDKSDDAFKLYGLQGIGLPALLRETGFSKDDMPSDDDLERALLIDLVKGAPSLFPQIAPLLGIKTTIPALPVTETGAPVPGAADAPAEGQPPVTREDPAPSDVTAAAAGVALLEATDGLVYRALEHAGNRLRNRARARGPEVVATLNGTDTAHAHTVVDASDLAELGSLLDGAWRRAPEVAQRHGIDPDAYVGALDRYAKVLLAGQLAHSYDLMVQHFDPELEPAPA